MKNAVITILITIININIIHYYLFISDSYSSEKNIIIVSSNYYYYIIIVVVIIIIIVIVVVVVVVIIIILISRFTPLYLFSSAFLNPLLSLLRAFSDSSCRRLSRSWKTAAGTITRP